MSHDLRKAAIRARMAITGERYTRAATAHPVELACVAVASILGGLPRNMTHDDAGDLSSPEFKRLARAGLNGRNDAMFTEAEALTVDQRHAAVNTALDTLVGQPGMAGPE